MGKAGAGTAERVCPHYARPERKGTCNPGGGGASTDFGRFSLWRPTVADRMRGSELWGRNAEFSDHGAS